MKAFVPNNSMPSYTSRINSGITGSLADRKRPIAIIAPPITIISMYFIFQSLAGTIENERIAWYLGMAIYWLLWGAVFPLIMIGRRNIGELVKPQSIKRKILLLLSIPLIGTIAAKLVPGMGEYEKESVLITFLLFTSPFCNGLFEEVLWRGVYVKLFPINIFFRMIWPSIWFGIWHYVPVSMHNHELTGLVGMMVGPIMMGLYFSYLTHKTNTLWWAIVAHTVGGIIMIA